MHHAYPPERDVPVGISQMSVRVPNVRSRSRTRIKFNSELLSPCRRRAQNIMNMLSWLYLKGVSMDDMRDALLEAK